MNALEVKVVMPYHQNITLMMYLIKYSINTYMEYNVKR